MMKTASKNKKRRRRTSSSISSASSNSNKNSNSNVGSISKPLLFRLSEAWNNHRIFHQNRRRQSQNDGDNSDGNGDDKRVDADGNPNDDEGESDKIPRRCCKDLKVLRAIIPKVEREYQLLPNYGRDLGSNDTVTSNGTGTGTGNNTGIRRQKRGGEINPDEIGDLCVFYGTIVTGTFCPHSHHLLFDEGRAGTESTFLWVCHTYVQ